MDEKLFQEEYVSEADKAKARNEFIREFAAQMGWDANNLNESQLQKVRSQSGYKAAGMLRS